VTLETSLRPGPVADEDSAPFWEGTKRHELVLQRCEKCGEVRFPPMSRCPNCGSPSWYRETVEPLGTVYSWITVERPIGSVVTDEVPCTFVVVELRVGCRMVGRLDGGSVVAIGDAVTAVFADWSDWTEVRFQLDGASPNATTSGAPS
jgi:uncharacterized OB-fold protein